MLCEHSNRQQYVPFFACNICEHLRVLCERGLKANMTTKVDMTKVTEKESRVHPQLKCVSVSELFTGFSKTLTSSRFLRKLHLLAEIQNTIFVLDCATPRCQIDTMKLAINKMETETSSGQHYTRIIEH